MLKNYSLLFSIFLISFCIKAQNDTTFLSNGKIDQVVSYTSGLKEIQKFNYSGKLIRHAQYFNDLRHGFYREYHSNGKLKIEAQYENDLLVGTYKEFNGSQQLLKELNYRLYPTTNGYASFLDGESIYYHRSGTPKSRIPFKKGKKEGLMLVYSANTNEIIEKSTFKNDKKWGLQERYYANGFLESRKYLYQDTIINKVKHSNLIEGILEEYFKNGNKRKEVEYLNGMATGNSNLWHENGKLRTVSKMISDSSKEERYYNQEEQLTLVLQRKMKPNKGYMGWVDHGIKEHYKNEKLQSKEFYANGKKEGYFESYHSNGQLASRTLFKDDKLIGESVSYFEDGKPQRISRKENIKNWNGGTRNVEVGWQKRFDKNGKLEAASYFDSRGQKWYQHYKHHSSAAKTTVYRIGGADWYINFYADGTLREEAFGYPAYRFTNSFTIDGKIHKVTLNSNANENDELNMEWDGMGKSVKLKDPNSKAKPSNDYAFSPKKYKFYNNELENGTEIIKYDNGQTRIKLAVKDRLLHGRFELYRPNGSLAFFTHFENGKEKGASAFLNEKGDTLCHYFYGMDVYSNTRSKDGVINISRKDSLGNRKYAYESYKGEKPKLLEDHEKQIFKRWQENGKLTSEVYPLQDHTNRVVHKNYFANGLLSGIYYSKNKKKAGEHLVYHKNGSLSARFEYLNDLKEGPYISYFEDGSLRSKGQFIKDKKEGLWEVNVDGKIEQHYYKNNKKQVELPTSTCACIDTSKAIGRSFYNSLSSYMDYRAYQRYTFSFFNTIDSALYQRLFVGYANIHENSGYFNLISFRKIDLTFSSNPLNYIRINPCHTNGYLSVIPFRYSIYRNDITKRVATFETNKLDFNFKNTLFRQENPHGGLRVQLSSASLQLNEVNHVQLEESFNDLCFEPIQLGAWSLVEARALVIPQLPLKRAITSTSHRESLFKLTLDRFPMHKNGKSDTSSAHLHGTALTGLFLNAAKGTLLIDQQELSFSSSCLLLSDDWNGGYFIITARAIGVDQFQLESSTGISFIVDKASLVEQLASMGFQQIQANFVKDQDKLEISFLNCEF